jgi:multiple sugar transport system substrate-binding protein
MLRFGSAVSRRGALRGLATAATAAASGAVLAACASRTSNAAASSAAPSTTPQGINVPFQLWVPAVPVNKTSTALIQQFFDTNFSAQNKGVRAVWAGQGGESGVVTDVLAGASTTPWVVASCCGDWPVIQPFLAPLDQYFKNDNIDVATTWQAGQLSRFQQNGTTYGLPEDAACDAYLYRQDILDELGLPYPDPTWTSDEAASLWRACSGKLSTGAWRYGVGAPFGPGATEGLPTVVSGFGGQFMSADQTQCLIDSPQGIAAGEFWMSLVADKVATAGDGTPPSQMWNGTCVFGTGAEPTIIDAVENLGDKAKWDFLPWPKFPAHSVGKLHDNFYGMLQSAPQPEVAWNLLKFIAIDPEWQRFYMQLALAPPGVASLLEEWYTVMQATAPILKGKQLQYWGTATLAGEGVYDYEFFRYAPVQANNLVTNWFNQAWAGTVTVTQAWTQMAQQINALEAQSQAEQAQSSAVAKNFPTNGKAIASVVPGI